MIRVNRNPMTDTKGARRGPFAFSGKRTLLAGLILATIVCLIVVFMGAAKVSNRNAAKAPNQAVFLFSKEGLTREWKSARLVRQVPNGMPLAGVRDVFGADGHHAGAIENDGNELQVYYWYLPNTSWFICVFEDDKAIPLNRHARFGPEFGERVIRLIQQHARKNQGPTRN